MGDINEIVSAKAVQSIIDANNALQGTAKQLTAVIDVNEKLQKQLDEAAKATNELNVKSTAYTQILNATEKEQVKINATAKQMQLQQKQLIDIEAKLAVAHSEENKALIAKKIALQEANKAEKEKLKTDQAEEGSLTRMRQKLADLTKAYDDSGKRTRSAAKEIANLSREIQTAEQETNRFQRGVGDYRNNMQNLFKSFTSGEMTVKQFSSSIKMMGKSMLTFLASPVGMIVAAVSGLALVGRALINNAQEFDKASSSLSAITGATGEDLDFMKKKAIEYSKTSVSSATDIVKAFEKIGSAMPALLSQKELLTEVTKNAITLSEASGGGLSIEDAAKAAASAINQFNIPLTESARVVNVLAAGSLAGSAEVGDLAESFKNAGTVAAGAGMSLEQTVGALEVLGEKSLYGAEAGTKLRGAILKLQDAGLGYASGVFNYRDALVEANAQLKTQGSEMQKDALAAKLFGAENITAGKILVDNIDKYDSLTEAITNNKTAAEDMAKTQKNNLDSSYKLLGNAWKGLMLSMEDGSGIIMKVWKGIIDGITWALNAISSVGDKFRSKEAVAAKKQAQETEAAEERKRASLLKTAEQMGIQLTEKMTNAEIEKKINEEVTKNTVAEEDKKAKEAAKAAEKKKEQQEKGFKLAADIAEKGTELNRKALEDQKKDQEEFSKWENDMLKDSFEKDKAIFEASVDFSIAESDREYRRKVLLINATTKDKKEAAEKIFKLDVESAQNSIASMTTVMNLSATTEEEKWQYKEKIAAAQMDLDEMVAEHEVDTAEKAAEKKKKLQESIYEASMSVANSLFDFMDSKYAGELTALEQKNEAGLLSDQEYATQKAEIEIKQAKATRARGIFDATINTATAVIKALADPGGIAGVILSVAAGVTGALQIASILSTPLPVMPAFEHGTLNAPETFRAAERNKRELGYLNNGEVVMFEKDGIYSDPKFKGARIVPNAMTEAIMSQTKAPTYNQSSMSDTRIVNELKAVRKSIDNSQKPIIDNRGEIIGTYNRNHREINRSKRYTPWA